MKKFIRQIDDLETPMQQIGKRIRKQKKKAKKVKLLNRQAEKDHASQDDESSLDLPDPTVSPFIAVTRKVLKKGQHEEIDGICWDLDNEHKVVNQDRRLRDAGRNSYFNVDPTLRYMIN